jgi:hypothetical protein
MGSAGFGAVDVGAEGWIYSVRLAFDLNVALSKIRTVDCSTATLVNGYLFIYVLHSIFTRRTVGGLFKFDSRMHVVVRRGVVSKHLALLVLN